MVLWLQIAFYGSAGASPKNISNHKTYYLPPKMTISSTFILLSEHQFARTCHRASPTTQPSTKVHRSEPDSSTHVIEGKTGELRCKMCNTFIPIPFLLSLFSPSLSQNYFGSKYPFVWMCCKTKIQQIHMFFISKEMIKYNLNDFGGLTHSE